MFKLIAFSCLFCVAISINTFAQSAETNNQQKKICTDDTKTNSNGSTPCGPFVFLSAIRPDAAYSIFHPANPGQVFTVVNKRPNSTTVMKFADETDPSIILYMPDDRLRFFIPSIDTDKLAQAPWQYRDCTYHIAAISMLDHSIYRADEEKSVRVPRRFTVESVCDEPAHYMFDAAFGLFSFTFGSYTNSASGEKAFVPGETFFEVRNTYGYGAMKSPFPDLD